MGEPVGRGFRRRRATRSPLVGVWTASALALVGEGGVRGLGRLVGRASRGVAGRSSAGVASAEGGSRGGGGEGEGLGGPVGRGGEGRERTVHEVATGVIREDSRSAMAHGTQATAWGDQSCHTRPHDKILIGISVEIQKNPATAVKNKFPKMAL